MLNPLAVPPRISVPLKVFIGSSSKARECGLVEYIAEYLQSLDAEPTPWWLAEEFGGSISTLEGLLRAAREYDFALFIFTSDDVTTTSAGSVPSIRDNVLFEYGLFLGALSTNRVFAIMENSQTLKKVSDIDGINIPRFTFSGWNKPKAPVTPIDKAAFMIALTAFTNAFSQAQEICALACADAGSLGEKLIDAPHLLEHGIRTRLTNIYHHFSRLLTRELISDREKPFFSHRAQIIIRRCEEKLEKMPNWTRINNGNFLPWATIRLREIKSSFNAISLLSNIGTWTTPKGKRYFALNVEANSRLILMGQEPIKRAFVYHAPDELVGKKTLLKRILKEHLDNNIETFLPDIALDAFPDFAIYDNTFVSVWQFRQTGVSYLLKDISKVEWSTDDVARYIDAWDSLLRKCGECMQSVGDMESRVDDIYLKFGIT